MQEEKIKMDQKPKRVTFQTLDVSCRQCAIDVRRLLEKQSGVVDIKVNEMLNIFYVDYNPEKISEEDIEKTVKKIGYKTVKLRSMKDAMP